MLTGWSGAAFLLSFVVFAACPKSADDGDGGGRSDGRWRRVEPERPEGVVERRSDERQHQSVAVHADRGRASARLVHRAARSDGQRRAARRMAGTRIIVRFEGTALAIDIDEEEINDGGSR